MHDEAAEREFLLPVRWLQTAEEREVVAQFRAQFVQSDDLDACVGPIAGPDEDPFALETGVATAFVRMDEQVVGMLRMRCCARGEVPPSWLRTYALERLPRADSLAYAELSSIFVAPDAAERGVLDALTTVAMTRALEEVGVDLVLASCSPGELRDYQRLGFRPYGASLVSTVRGARIPMVAVLADLDHFRVCGSPWFTTLYLLHQRDKLPDTDLSGFGSALAGRRGVEDRPLDVLAAIRDRDATRGTDVLAELPPMLVQLLAGSGFVLDVDAGTEVLGPGAVGQEAYIVLSGLFEVSRGPSYLTTHLPGEMFGQLALFRDGSRRTAAVCAVTQGRLLVIHRSFIEELRESDPAAAFALVAAMARLLSERLAQV